jgi:hypothetical protein
MTSFSSQPAGSAGRISPTSIEAHQPELTCRTTSPDAVRRAEDELDRCIQELSADAVLAKAAGDHVAARDLTDRWMALLLDRSPQHIARLEREAWERIDRDVCYFSAMGERDRAGLYDVNAKAVRRRMGETK